MFDNSCNISEAGVIGYEPRNIFRSALSEAANNPHAVA